VREVWDANADFWDERMGEGNATHRLIVGPTIERLLDLRPGEAVLEVACGNGQLARRMAALGARVLAVDLSEAMLARARARSRSVDGALEFRVLDGADRASLASLGTERFDAVVCNMALMDMDDIEPLAEALPRLLRPDGRFVFSVVHPSFNGPAIRRVREEEDDGGRLVERAGVFVYGYANPCVAKGLAIAGQPRAQLCFHRPLGALLEPFFRAGLVLDALAEPTFGPDVPAPRPMSWVAIRDIPMALAGRLRPPSRLGGELSPRASASG
jgi:SAM-dependent methyltransferase